METNSFQSETMNFMASQFQVATERLVNVLCVAVGIKRTNCDLWHFYANDSFMCFFMRLLDLYSGRLCVNPFVVGRVQSDKIMLALVGPTTPTNKTVTNHCFPV